jgi:beta-galactosidase
MTIAADGEDVSIIEVRVVDAKDRLVPTADKASARRAFNGLCMAIAQSTKQASEIRIEASAPGLEPATVVIRSEQVILRPALA